MIQRIQIVSIPVTDHRMPSPRTRNGELNRQPRIQIRIQRLTQQIRQRDPVRRCINSICIPKLIFEISSRHARTGATCLITGPAHHSYICQKPSNFPPFSLRGIRSRTVRHPKPIVGRTAGRPLFSHTIHPDCVGQHTNPLNRPLEIAHDLPPGSRRTTTVIVAHRARCIRRRVIIVTGHLLRSIPNRALIPCGR